MSHGTQSFDGSRRVVRLQFYHLPVTEAGFAKTVTSLCTLLSVLGVVIYYLSGNSFEIKSFIIRPKMKSEGILNSLNDAKSIII
jgi:hypothetical protein